MEEIKKFISSVLKKCFNRKDSIKYLTYDGVGNVHYSGPTFNCLYFYRDGCGHCQRLAPQFIEILKKFFHNKCFNWDRKLDECLKNTVYHGKDDNEKRLKCMFSEINQKFNGLIHFEAHEIVLDSAQNSKNPKIEEFKIDGTPITIMIITDKEKGKIIERIEGDDDSGIEKHLRNHFGECSEN